ncbi:hypothetical protein L0Y69_02790 [bacterium]|nr:hypothetical protein [bacterium]
MSPASLAPKRNLSSSVAVMGLRELLKDMGEPEPNAGGNSATGNGVLPEGWDTYKDMKAAWILSSENLPPTVRDDMKEVASYIKTLHEILGREPRANETAEEYANTTHITRETQKEQPEGVVPRVAQKEGRGIGTDYIEESEEKSVPKQEFSEIILHKWDEAIVGKTENETKNMAPKEAPPIALIPPLKKPVAVPKKPPLENVQYMRDAATPAQRQVIEAPKAAGTVSTEDIVSIQKKTPEQARPRHYPEPLLADIVERGAGMTKGAWEDLRNRPAQDAVSENTSLQKYVKELRLKHQSENSDPHAGETTAEYVERLLPQARA